MHKHGASKGDVVILRHSPHTRHAPQDDAKLLRVSNVKKIVSIRHARACPGHPRLSTSPASKTWMAGMNPAMTMGWAARSLPSNSF